MDLSVTGEVATFSYFANIKKKKTTTTDYEPQNRLMMDLDEAVNSVMAVRSTSLKLDSGSEIVVCGIIVQVCDS